MSTIQPPKQAQLPNGKPSTPPNQTIFVSNLNTKIRKDDLRRALYCLFSTYGPVLDIVALKSQKMKGQAHVVFRDVQASSQAMRSLQGYDFFAREMRLSYAKSKSDVVSRLDGSAKAPESSKTLSTSTPAMTETQKSVFQNPHAALPNKPLPPPHLAVGTADGEKLHGVKRPRDEDEEVDNDESGGDAPMEEDSGGSAMEESDEE